MAITTIERAFARGSLYRFLSLAFAYPTADLHRDLLAAMPPAITAAGLISDEVRALATAATRALGERDRRALASEYRKAFTFSASPDCPLNECAYGSRHIYQEVHDLADIAAFYTAFGLEIAGERPDGLAPELEFCALLALKEGVARERGLPEQALRCREGTRLFLHDHLGRWAENIGRRIELLAPDTAYAPLGRLLAGFAAWDVAAMRAGPIDPYQEVPRPPEEIGDESCPAEEGIGTPADMLQDTHPEAGALSLSGKGGL